MKKLVLSASAMLAMAGAFAQPTLTQATSAPVPGDRYYGHYCDTTGVSRGASGASVTWSFPALTETGRDTTSYVPCLGTPGCDSFPGSNIVSYDNSSYTYGMSTADSFYFTGYYSAGTVTHLTDPGVMMRFPLSYGGTFSDVAELTTTISGFTGYITFTNNSTADAWGTLTLPSGAYPNVLRVHTIAIVKDSINVLGMPIVNITQTDNYDWYSTSFHGPLLQMAYDTVGASSEYLSQLKYNTVAPPLSAGTVTTAFNNMDVSPNPASNVINLSFELAERSPVTFTVTDLVGRTVATLHSDNMMAGRNSMSIEAGSFPSGMYIVAMQTPAGTITRKVTVNN